MTRGQASGKWDDLESLFSAVEERIGLKLRERDKVLLAKHTKQVLEQECVSLDRYIQELRRNISIYSSDKWIAIEELITTKETYFFRDLGQLRGIEDIVFPQLFCPSQSLKEIKVLSAGCASGEELYSLCMLMAEYKQVSWIGLQRVSGIGLDISRVAIEIAKQGMYKERSFRGIDNRFKLLREKYFDRYISKNKAVIYKIKPLFLGQTKFYECNILNYPYSMVSSGTVDLIVCRNVFIYFNEVSIRRCLDAFHSLLRPRGFLVVGHAELKGYEREYFNVIMHRDTLIYQKR